MADTDVETLATSIARQILAGDREARLDECEIGAAIARSLRAAVALERAACERLCAARHALWAAAEEKTGNLPEHMRRDARARSNEAAYLADAIRARTGGQ